MRRDVLGTAAVGAERERLWHRWRELNKSLDGAKVLAHDWVDNIAPKMTASIPTHLIDYGTTYQAVTDEIMYEIMRLSGREYVDIYARPAKSSPLEPAA